MWKQFSYLTTAGILALVAACGQAPSTAAPSPDAGPLVQSVWEAQHDLRVPTGIALDSSQNVYVIDGGNQRIVKFDTSGAYVTAWGSSGEGDGQFTFYDGHAHFGGIAINPQNEVLVADHSGRVQVFDASGKFLRVWSSGQRPSFIYAMALDRAGDVYLAADNQVKKFSPDGHPLGKWPSVPDSGAANVLRIARKPAFVIARNPAERSPETPHL